MSLTGSNERFLRDLSRDLEGLWDIIVFYYKIIVIYYNNKKIIKGVNNGAGRGRDSPRRLWRLGTFRASAKSQPHREFLTRDVAQRLIVAKIRASRENSRCR